MSTQQQTEDTPDYTTIRITKSDADRLHDFGRRNESYAETFRRVMDTIESNE